MEEKRKICPVCNVDKLVSDFQLNPDGSIRKHVCKLCYGRKWRAQVKLEMLNAFGRKCQCCGEENPQFLTLDHVDNDGGKQRAEVKEAYNSTNSELIYQAARREGWPKDKYQLLCMNCNFAKGHWGICPHRSGLTADSVYADLESRIFRTGKQHQNMNLEPLKLGPKVQHKRALDPMEMALHLFSKLSPEDAKNILEKFKVQGP